MRHYVEMGLDPTIYVLILSFIKTASSTQNSIGGNAQTGKRSRMRILG
jgi:hypothetical protein